MPNQSPRHHDAPHPLLNGDFLHADAERQPDDNSALQVQKSANTQPYEPCNWELQHGKIADGVFYRPIVGLYKDGEPILIHGCTFSYPYRMANDILLHLKAVSDADFSLVPYMWDAMPNAVITDPSMIGGAL